MQEIAILQTKILTLKMENTSVKALTVKNSTKIRRCAIFCDLQIFDISYILYRAIVEYMTLHSAMIGELH